ncbi:phosphatidylinositol N-acetylglucosaminyltransferase subunit C [Vararia minispora EC-137]|uniref:Phosphatidylinositol N-acetylglucosaminyltransferase subunit C n=1 Tax=Vararia minispora EC-137 TaxID=1314806 RepID=A0ACB8QMT7_9AGAM|nr:phosphatidylinositol N-acetylglucosaminyltransferase subunit C [Vararia minispora EC-137]
MSKTTWERVLWKEQPYPDNYVPPTFLSSLVKNSNVQPYTYWELVIGSCAITQHISTISIFLVAFIHLRHQTLDPRLLVFASTALFVTGFLVWEILSSIGKKRLGTADSDRRARAARASILVFLALIALAPILRTLTDATSSDSVWALSACLFILNAALADYSTAHRGGRVRERLTSVLSMNAAISAAVVLASRLHEDLSVFALVLFAVQLFALFPILRHRLQSAPVSMRIALTTMMSTASVFLMGQVSRTAMLLFGAAMASASFVAPAVLVRAQAFKNELHGPWDVATPKVVVCLCSCCSGLLSFKFGIGVPDRVASGHGYMNFLDVRVRRTSAWFLDV